MTHLTYDNTNKFQSPYLIQVAIVGLILGFIAFFAILFDSSIPLIEEISSTLLIIFIMAIVILIRLESTKFGLLILTTLTFFVLSITMPFFISVPRPYLFGDWDQLPKVLVIFFSILVLSILLEILLLESRLPRFRFESFTFPELTVIAIVGVLDAGILISFEYSPIRQISFFFIFFSLAMLNVLCRLIIDKFGTISLIMLVFSLIVSTTSFSITTPLSEYFSYIADLSKADLILAGILIGMVSDEVFGISNLKNIMHVVRGVKNTYINTSYIGLPSNFFRGVSYGIISSMMMVILFSDLRFELWVTELIGIMATIGVLGGAMGAVIYSNFSDSMILSLVRPWYKQMWVWELDSAQPLALNIGKNPIEANADSNATRWVTCIAIDDIDNDNLNEIIVGTGDYYIRCYKKGNIFWEIKLGNVAGKCAIGDIDGDGNKEFVVGCYDGILWCFDNKGQEKWHIEIGKWVWCCAIGDVDGDTINEVVIGSFDNLLRCYKKGREIWQLEFNSWLGCCAIGDVDGDGINEIVAGSKDGTLRLLKNGIEVWRAIFDDWVMCCAIGDIDGDGINEVIAGSNDGTLRCYKGDNEIWRISFYAPVASCAVGDIDNDHKDEIIVGCGDNTLKCIKNGKETWAVDFDDYIGCCVIGDVDNDGINEVIAGDWSSKLRCFKTVNWFTEHLKNSPRKLK